MSSSSIKSEIKIITIEEEEDSAPDSRSSSVVDKTSSDEFELARDHLSSMYVLEYETENEVNDSPPNTYTCNAKKSRSTYKPKKKGKVRSKTKTGVCNCKTFKQNLLANRKPKLETTTAPEPEAQTNVSQTYNICVPEISTTYSPSGIITIPIELRLCLKQSQHNTPVKQEKLPKDAKPVSEKEKWPTIKCIYQDCSKWEYMETYLDELLDDPGVIPDSEYGNDLVFNAECTDHYAEPYHQAGYDPKDEYSVPIDLEDLIPPEYYAFDKDSFSVEKVSEKELSAKADDDTSIHWEDVCLPPKGTVLIARAPTESVEQIVPHRIPLPEGYKPPPSRADAEESEKKKKKCGGFSSCCGGEDDDDDEGYCVSPRKKTSKIIFQPVPKLSLIYGSHCPENEPYTHQLMKAYPHLEMSDSPCSSETEIPWLKIILPEAVKIRSVDILTEAETEPSTTTKALCLCPSYKDKSDVKNLSKPNVIPAKKAVSIIDPCICASTKEKLSNLPDKLDVKPDTKKLSEPNTTSSKNSVTFRDNKLVTLYPPPNAQSKSNTIKQEGKESIGSIKTTLSGTSKSDQGIMRTKVTVSGKDLSQLLKSEGKSVSSNITKGSGCPNLERKPVCPPTSEVKVSSSHSAPVLPKQEPCVPDTCPSKIKGSSTSHTIKPDPVISALIACEAELKPVKQALNTVQQKLRNMNMPELDSIFSKGTELANMFLNKAQQNKCPCTTKYACGYNPATTMKPAKIKFMNDKMKMDAQPMSSCPASYTSPSASSTYMPQKPKPYVEQRPFRLVPYYGQYKSSSPSQSSFYAASVQNFSLRPNYDRNDLYPEERGSSKSALRRPGSRNKKHVKYQRDQSEDSRSPDRSERNCGCSSSNYSRHNGFHMKKSVDEMSFTSSSSPSEDSMSKKRRSRRRHRRLVPKVKSKNSGIVSKQSLCPFLEAMKSIMILDNKKTVKKGSNGVSYDTRLSTKKIKNMRMHMRVRTSTKSKKKVD